METLRRQLDDPTAKPCGRCSRCTGESRTIEFDRSLVIEAQEFLRGQNLALKPRKQYPAGTRIAAGEQLADGWALARAGDGGWGPLIAEGKETGAFDDELVDALAKLLGDQHPDQAFEWVTAVPSRRSGDLVPSFAARLADRLGLAFHPVLTTVRDTAPQADMENSAQQASNVGGAFDVTEPIPDAACLLVDDVWSSGWTLTVLAQLLRSHGSGPVYGAVLAQAT
jgi:ATP-dependent DNA helicase RecQ